MDYKVISRKHNGVVGEGLSRGEVNQFILDYYRGINLGTKKESEEFLEDFEDWIYDLSDEKVQRDWVVPIGDTLTVEEER